MEKFENQNVKINEDKKINIGYDYTYETTTIKSMFINGEECFMASEIAKFISNRNYKSSSQIDKLRQNGVSFILNKWEMEMGGFEVRGSKMKTFTNRFGILLIIESSSEINEEKIHFIEDSITNIEPVIPSYIKRELNYQMVDLKDLKFDYSYQRKASVDKIRNIVRQFDYGVIGALIVSKRENGDLFVIDGQHRIFAMSKVNLTNVMAVIHTNLTVSDEANLFKKCNNTRKTPSALDNYKADLVGKNKEIMEINQVVIDCGYTVNIERDKHIDENEWVINAVGALTKVYKENGSEGLRDTLTTLKLAGVRKPISADIGGIGMFLRTYKGKYDKTYLIKKISNVSQVELIAKARQMVDVMGGHLTTNYARIVLNIYNERRKEPLMDIIAIGHR